MQGWTSRAARGRPRAGGATAGRPTDRSSGSMQRKVRSPTASAAQSTASPSPRGAVWRATVTLQRFPALRTASSSASLPRSSSRRSSGEIGTQMRRERLLALGEDEHDLVGAGRHRFLNRPLDHRAIENREQLFRKLLGGGEKARSQARGRDHAWSRSPRRRIVAGRDADVLPVTLARMPDTRTLLIKAVREALDAAGVDRRFRGRPRAIGASGVRRLVDAGPTRPRPRPSARARRDRRRAVRSPQRRPGAARPRLGGDAARVCQRPPRRRGLGVTPCSPQRATSRRTGALDLPTEVAAASGKTLVEHTATNPNKAAHVGHLRNACIGDTVARVLRGPVTPSRSTTTSMTPASRLPTSSSASASSASSSSPASRSISTARACTSRCRAI